MIPYIIIVFSFIFDLIFSNFLPYMEGDLSLFTPLITIVSIFLIVEFFDKEYNKYYITCFVVGMLYDLFFTDLLFLNGFLFLGIGFISKFIYKNEKMDYIRVIFYLIFIICLYEGSIAFLITVFNIVPITFNKVIYKISHSIILNIIYGEILFFIINILSKRFKKRRLN